MEKTATTVEQSEELFRLGINPETASMFWVHVKDKDLSVTHVLAPRGESSFKELQEYQNDCFSLSPAWDLQDLINLLPDEITISWWTYELFIGEKEIGYRLKSYPVRYWQNFWGDTLIDAAVKAIVELKHNKII